MGARGVRVRAAGRKLSLLVFWVALPLAAQPPARPAPAPPSSTRIAVALSPSELTVGDRVEATLTLTLREAELAGPPRFPTWREGWGDAEVLEKSEPERVGETGGIATYRQRLVLTAFKPGKVALPPVAVAVPLAGRTDPVHTPPHLALTVRSVLPPGEKDPQPKPAAPPRPLPIGEPFWWTLAALSAACLLLAFFLHRQRRAAAAADDAAGRPPLPPFDELLGELDRLGAEPSPLAVHTRLSLALRRYLGRTLSFPAAESTTSEIHRQLLGRRVPGPLVRRAVELLRACDLVKFARQEVGEERARERVALAREIARELEAHVRPVEPETPLEAAG